MVNGCYHQDERDTAVGYGCAFLAIVALLILGWILWHVLPILADAAWFVVEGIWFLAFKLFG